MTTEAQNQVEEQLGTEATPPCDTEAKLDQGNASDATSTEASSTADSEAATASTVEATESVAGGEVA